MKSASEPANSLRNSIWITGIFFLVHLVIALACLRQWRGEAPWARLDIFSGGTLFLNVFWAAGSLRFQHAITRSREVMREASGSSYDPKFLLIILLLSFGEFIAYLDYGHWHFSPALEIPAVQALGLIFSIFGLAGICRVDAYLTRHFSSEAEFGRVMTKGPYRFVRHPRYFALLISRLAFALALASVFAWALALLWLLGVLRRVRLEELHLRELFGSAYDDYAQRTSRLIPGIY